MKKTVNINLGGLVFQIDEDAYQALDSYMTKLRLKFKNTEGAKEIIEDIEYRFAEIFSEKLDKRIEVVSLPLVERTIETLGQPEAFESEESVEKEVTTTTQTDYSVYDDSDESSERNHRRLFRDPDDMVLGGVLSGIAAYFGLGDPVWIRIITVISVFAGAGFPIPLYFVLWILLPKAENTSEKLQMRGEAVNLSSIEGLVKKNINSDQVRRTSSEMAHKLGGVVKIGLKIVLLFIALGALFKLFILTITGGIFTVAANAGLHQEVLLLFPGMLNFNILLFALFMVFAIPLAVIMYLGFKGFTKSRINWAKLSIFGVLFWLISLAVTGGMAATVASGFKAEAKKVVDVSPVNQQINTIYLMAEPSEVGSEFQLTVNHGAIVTDGMLYDSESKEMLLKSVSLKLIPSEDSALHYTKILQTRGESQKQAENLLAQFETDLFFENDSTVNVPQHLTLTDCTKWRAQTLRFNMAIPLGKQVYFKNDMSDVLSSSSLSNDYDEEQLKGNTWEMTADGLICLSCN